MPVPKEADSQQLLLRYIAMLRDPNSTPEGLTRAWAHVRSTRDHDLIREGFDAWAVLADELVGNYDSWRTSSDGVRLSITAASLGLEDAHITDLGRCVHLVLRRFPAWVPPEDEYSRIIRLSILGAGRGFQAPDLRAVLEAAI